MAHGNKSDEKVVYVGDSRVKKQTKTFIPADYSSYPGKSEAFIPNFLLKEWMVAVVALVGVLALVMTEPAPLGKPADPLTPGFIPMPDWYFLFMYQLLKYPYTSGDFKLIGTLVLPGIMFGALLLAPFLDTGKERRFYKRPIASSLMFLSLASVVYLTVFSWHHYKLELEEKGIKEEHSFRYEEKLAQNAGGGTGGTAGAKLGIVAKDDPGYEVYKKATCLQCHGTDLKGKSAPSLIGVGDKYTADDIMKIVKEGTESKAMGAQYDSLKSSGLSDDDISTMVNWLAMQKK